MMIAIWTFLFACSIIHMAMSLKVTSYTTAGRVLRRFNSGITSMAGFPRPIHKDFTVEKATPEKMEELGVKSWPTWSTAGSEKYKVGIKSPLKVYDSNELSYIISGDMEIIPKETGVPVPVRAGDFVTFPDGFECYWFVKETIKKHWYIY